MNTSYLKTFIEVINLKNISKAADKLFITQPAVSKQLQILEKDFGTVLIKKEGRDIIPTDSGKELYKYALNLLSQENRIYNKIKKEGTELDGVLNVFSSSLPADYYIPDIICEFNKQHPSVDYEVRKVDSKQVYTNIEDGIINFGFTGAIFKKNKLNYVTIAQDELIVVGGAEQYGKFKNKKMTIDFLLENDFISREIGSATLKTFENYLNANGIELDDLQIKVRVEDNEVIKKLIRNGMGITIVSRIAVEKELNEESLVQIKIGGMNLKRQLYFVYHGGRYYSRVEEAFKNYIIGKYE